MPYSEGEVLDIRFFSPNSQRTEPGDMTKVIIDTPEGLVEVIRTKNDMQLIDGVLQPMVPAAEVRPVGELEVLDALKSHDSVWSICEILSGVLSRQFQAAFRFPITKLRNGW